MRARRERRERGKRGSMLLRTRQERERQRQTRGANGDTETDGVGETIEEVEHGLGLVRAAMFVDRRLV